MNAKDTLGNYSDFINPELEKWKVPGIAVAVVKDGEVIHSEGYGYRDVAQSLPVTSDTIFAIGSSTKAFTAASVAAMVDDGKLEWDKPVRDTLPTFRLHDPFATERMTPRDLLCHRSGLPRHDLMWYNSKFTREEIISRLPHLLPSKDFRTNFQYQNLMYLTAGYLVGLVAGTTWEAVVQERIFKPLGMVHSQFSVDESQQAPDFALPYREHKDEVTQIPFRNITTIGPAGSINSNLKDMAHWAAFQLTDGKFNDQQVLTEASLKQLHASQMVIEDPMWGERFGSSLINYALGWFVQVYRGETLIHHGGNIDGFSALVSFMPGQKAAVIALTNMNGSPLPMIASFNVYDRLLGLEHKDWSGEFKQFYDKMKAQMEKGKEESASNRKPNTQPSHPLEAYVGEYEHPGYGVIAITQGEKGLQLAYNDLPMPMEHYHYDTFEAKMEQFEQSLKVSFFIDALGNIGSLALQLEPSVKESVFTRLPDKSLMNKDFLEQFTGEYDVMDMTLAVYMKGDDKLVASIPGQGEFELVPYQGTTFNLKDMSGFSVEFRKNGGSDITEALITQPGASFAAKKR